MHQITLLVHTDGSRSCLFQPEAVSHESIAMLAYPYISTELMEELQSQSTTRSRVNEILNSLVNL